MRGCFVTGTDTGAGKSVLAAALRAAMAAAGERVAAFKPVVTGVEEPLDCLEPPSGGRLRDRESTDDVDRRPRVEARHLPPGRQSTASLDRHPRAGLPDLPPDCHGAADMNRRPHARTRDLRSSAGVGRTDDTWPADHVLLAAVTGAQPHEVCARTFVPAVSPHLAAQLAGATIGLDALVAAAASAAANADVLVVEGVGGLLVPLSDEHDVRDLAVALGLPLVIAARPGLGTINHSLLTIEAARGAGLDVRAVVLTPWPDEPTVMQRSNRETIARRGGVEVATLPEVACSIEALAAAGASLAWPRWLGGVSI